MPEMERLQMKEKPWGFYLLLSLALLLLVYGVSQYLYPIVDAVDSREELGIDRVRKLIAEEKKLGLYTDHKPVYPDSSVNKTE